ncbi:MAG TPA: RNA-binding protein [Bacillota bacterium]|nr:RNA-binding protein [Bacillota bacterium]
MSKRIYVGNLPWSVTKQRLEELFSPFGEIEEALVIADKYTGRSRGFGFVTYKKDENADKAIEEMNEKAVEGRNLVVKLAHPSRESGEEIQKEQKPKETEKKPKKGKPAKKKEETKEEK